jgi:hypothetical protein
MTRIPSKLFYGISAALLIAVGAAGCGGVTFPKETLSESVIDLCKKEYGVTVDVSVYGTTLAIYLPLASLFDITLNLSDDAQERIQDVLMGVSRITLSTDADIQFYCIIAQDIRLPEVQLVVIKYVDDVKRAFYRNISRSEYFKRTLIDINENPQAKKERTIQSVFGKMELDKEWQEQVMDDFFRSPPSSLEGIGYWNGKFYVKNITLKEFLAEQMASRIKMRFRQEEDLKKFSLKSVTGQFRTDNNLSVFFVDFNAESLLFVIDPGEKTRLEREIFSHVFEEISDVIYGYKFTAFDVVKIIEKGTNGRLFISKEDVYLFKKHQLGMETVLGAVN